MIRSLRTVGVVALVVGAVLPACSSKSSGNGSPTFTSSLPSSQSLGNLSDADESRLCSEISDFETKAAASVQTNPCKLQGIVAAGVEEGFGRGTVTDAQLQKTCSDVEQSCAQTPARNFDAGTTTATCTKPTGTCTATVADLEACLNDLAALENQAYSKVPECSSLTVKDFSADAGLATTTTASQPPSCQKLQQECPTNGVTTGASASTAG